MTTVGSADLVLKNGRLLLESGLVAGGVGIKEGRICAIASDVHLPPADKVIDVNGRLILPGLIDGHAHIDDPAMSEHEDFTTGSMAAVAGGVTTVIDMPLTSQVDSVALVEQKVARGERMAIADFGVYGGMIRIDNIQSIGPLVERGVAAFKAFTCHPYAVSVGVIVRALSEVSEHGGHLTVHAESQGVLDEFSHDVDGEWDAPVSHSLSRPSLAEELAVREMIGVCRKTGGHLHIAHVSTREAVHEIVDARRAGVRVTTEVCPHHLMFDRDDMNRLGPKSKMNPPLRSREDRGALWAALLRGAIDIVVSDHAPAPIEKKMAGSDDIRQAWAGVDGIQMILSVLFSEGVLRGRLSLERLEEVTSRGPARLFGLYPRKGTIVLGADADLVIVDTKREEQITPEMMFSKSGWTLYEGRTMRGTPTMTIVRGVVVYEDGQVVGRPGHGRFQSMGHRENGTAGESSDYD